MKRLILTIPLLLTLGCTAINQPQYTVTMSPVGICNGKAAEDEYKPKIVASKIKREYYNYDLYVEVRNSYPCGDFQNLPKFETTNNIGKILITSTSTPNGPWCMCPHVWGFQISGDVKPLTSIQFFVNNKKVLETNEITSY